MPGAGGAGWATMAAADGLLATFATQGWVVIPDAIDPTRLEALRAAVDRGLAAVPPACPPNPLSGAGPWGYTSRRYPDPAHWDAAIAELTDPPPAAEPLIRAALGDAYWLQQNYAHALRPPPPSASSASKTAAAPGENGGVVDQVVVRGGIHQVPLRDRDESLASVVSTRNGARQRVPGLAERLWGGRHVEITLVYDLVAGSAEDGGFVRSKPPLSAGKISPERGA